MPLPVPLVFGTVKGKMLNLIAVVAKERIPCPKAPAGTEKTKLLRVVFAESFKLTVVGIFVRPKTFPVAAKGEPRSMCHRVRRPRPVHRPHLGYPPHPRPAPAQAPAVST